MRMVRAGTENSITLSKETLVTQLHICLYVRQFSLVLLIGNFSSDPFLAFDFLVQPIWHSFSLRTKRLFSLILTNFDPNRRGKCTQTHRLLLSKSFLVTMLCSLSPMSPLFTTTLVDAVAR